MRARKTKSGSHPYLYLCRRYEKRVQQIRLSSRRRDRYAGKHNVRKSGIDEQVTNQWFAKALYVRKISDLAFRLFFGQSGNIPPCSSVLDTFSARFRGITARAVVAEIPSDTLEEKRLATSHPRPPSPASKNRVTVPWCNRPLVYSQQRDHAFIGDWMFA